MRTTLILSALAACALAAPRPQEIEFDLVDAAPDVDVVTPPIVGTSESVPIQATSDAVSIGSSAVTDTTTTKRDALNKRDGDCSPQPSGTGPTVNTPDDTTASFLNYAPFHATAQKYAQPANVPQGYTLAFSDLNASSQTVSWLGYKTLSSYDPIACQQYCDSLDKCTAFNIYYERDPTIDPSISQNCANPPSITNIKCSRWGVQIQPETATNDGQTRANFKVVITGSNGYNKIAGPPSKTGYQGPFPLGGAINAPLDPTTKQNTYMGYKFFSLSTVQSYNDGVAACLAAATEQGAYNSRHPPKTGNPNISNQVVVYVLSMNNIPQGVYCSMYSESWASQYATNLGQYRGSDVYTVSQAYSYINSTYATNYGPICNVGGCDPYYKGGNCGGWGVGTC